MKPQSFVFPSTLFLSSVFFTSNLCAETVFWDDKANGQLLINCGPPFNAQYFAPNNINWSQSRVIAPNPCFNDPAVARAVELSNWSTDTAPNSTMVDVVLSGSSPVTVLSNDTNASVATLTVATTNELQIGERGALLVFGGIIQNDGRISLAERLDFAAVATLQIHADTLLSGTGTLVFDSEGYNTIDSSDPVHVFTVAAGQTLVTSPGTLAGVGGSRIIAALRNEGRITASQGELQLDTNPKVNTTTIEAINSGTIVLRNVTLNNTAGLLSADASSSVQLDNAIINGGLLGGGGHFDVAVAGGGNATLNGPLAIAPDANIYVAAQHKLFVTGTLTNNGTVRIFNASNNFANLEIVGNTTFLGSGQIVLDGDFPSFISSAAPADVLTIGPDQKVTTTSVTSFYSARISAAFTNQGTITANEGDLQIDTYPKTNNNLIQSIGGGEVLFKNVTVGNANGIIRAGSGSKVQLDNAIINGGILDGGGRFDVAVPGGGNATLNGPLTIAPDASVYVNGSHKLIMTGTVTNNGSVRLFNDVGSLASLEIVGNATLAGSGQIILDGTSNSRITSAAPGDMLTIGPDQKITTTSVTQSGLALIIAAFINQGTITASGGDLQLFRTNPKTNNGIFRASGGGTLEILSANTLLTNYNAVTGTLTGGCYEAIGNGSTIICENAPIKEIAAGTKVALAGAGSSIPALSMLQRVDGTLSLSSGATLSVSQSLVVSGRLEFGLGSGNTTTLAVNGDLDLTGSVIDISDLGAIDGNYQIITATGTVTGTPTFGNIPPGLGVSVQIAGGAVTLNIITAPEILGIARDAGTGAVTLTYQSIGGIVFGVQGSPNLTAFGEALPDTAVGNGGIMTYTNTPPANAGRYFYRMLRN